MPSLKLKESRIIRSEFIDTSIPPINDDGIEVKVSFTPQLPNRIDNDNIVLVKIKIEFGTKDQYIYILQEILCLFQITDYENNCSLTDEFLKKHCFPIAFSEGRKFFDSTTKMYGFPDIELPLWNYDDIPLQKSSE